MRDVEEFYSRISRRPHPPLMIDTMKPEAMELALSICGPNAILNSANLADLPQLNAVCDLARSHAASIVAGCRDAQGMATTRERKLEVTLRAVDRIAEKQGIAPEYVILDLLAFPVATSPEYFDETVAAIELIGNALPNTRTLLALSNFSYGLPERERTAVEVSALGRITAAGLDIAILNTSRHRRVTD